MDDTQKSFVHSIDQSGIKKTMSIPVVLILFVLLVGLGVSTGYIASKVTGGSSQNTTQKGQDVSNTPEGKTTAGILDKEVFKDTAEGTLREGGFEGEGSFHIERPGGPSQNVYLTSTTVDLSEFLGKKVKVWGQTFKASKAGWLMDVGYIEVE